jgi:uncharacterized protein (TIGR02284 family)
MILLMSALGASSHTNDEAIRALVHLLVICEDGVEGYRHAAAAVDDAAIQRVLAANAARREEVVSVLGYALVALGKKPPHHHGSLEGAVHRAFLDLEKLVGASGRTITRECQRGERATIAAFAETLALDLPADVKATVQSQLGRILEASEALARI